MLARSDESVLEWLTAALNLRYSADLPLLTWSSKARFPPRRYVALPANSKNGPAALPRDSRSCFDAASGNGTRLTTGTRKNSLLSFSKELGQLTQVCGALAELIQGRVGSGD